MKRIVSAIVAVAIILSMFAITSAATEVGAIHEEYLTYADGIAEAAEACKKSYEFPKNAVIYIHELSDIMNIVYDQYPLLYHLNRSYAYSYGTSNGTVKTVLLNYTMTEDEYTAARAEIDTWTNGIMSMTDPSFSDFEYALFFHDYLASNYEYDTDYSSRTLYSFIKSGAGVCQAYTYAYAHLLNKAGIESSTASSREMNHIWNLVKLDGKWYHADVTWDDPVGGCAGIAKHGFFLLSDKAIQAEGKDHLGWVSAYTCTSARYDSAAYAESESSMAKCGDYWYYLKNGDLYRTKDPAARGELYMELGMKWGGDGFYYVGSFGGIVSANGKLYVSSSTSIFEIDTALNTRSKVYTHSGNGTYIYGFTVDMGADMVSNTGLSNGRVILHIASKPGTVSKLVGTALFLTDGKLRGDANGDGKMNVADVTLLLKYIAKWAVEPDFTAADYDGNGVINVSDVTVMLKKIAGWDI